MPINFQTLRDQIEDMTRSADLRMRRQAESLVQARELLETHAGDPDALLKVIERAAGLDARLNTAVPTSEAIDGAFDAPPAPENGSILAVDGSQIFPDRHRAVHYSLINLGAISLPIGSGRARQHETRSVLLYDDELYIGTSRVSQRYISLIRDLKEREWLVDLAKELEGPVLTFTDGPLELWGAREGSGVEIVIDRKFNDYLAALRKLKGMGVITAGYIDKTGSDLVVRMLELPQMSPKELRDTEKARGFTGLSDAGLFKGIVGRYQRSAVFAMHTLSSKKYTDDLALHFFYLNVGTTPFGEPRFARVDLPAWVAADLDSVGRVHAALVEQCRALGAQPYPYLLHRAHEIALVTYREREQVDQMIRSGLLQSGMPTGYDSGKLGAKTAGPKGRYA